MRGREKKYSRKKQKKTLEIEIARSPLTPAKKEGERDQNTRTSD